MEKLEQQFPEPDDYYNKHGLWKFENENTGYFESKNFDRDLKRLEKKYPDFFNEVKNGNKRVIK